MTPRERQKERNQTTDSPADRQTQEPVCSCPFKASVWQPGATCAAKCNIHRQLRRHNRELRDSFHARHTLHRSKVRTDMTFTKGSYGRTSERNGNEILNSECEDSTFVTQIKFNIGQPMSPRGRTGPTLGSQIETEDLNATSANWSKIVIIHTFIDTKYLLTYLLT
jgi:hypothetical protein